MSSLFLGIEIVKRALAAHQQALNLTGHNIANAETEGYSRQRVRLEATTPLYPPLPNSPVIAGQIGTGVMVASVERVRDIYLDTRIHQETETLGYWEALYNRLHQVELVYNEPSGKGVRDFLNEFWASLQELANNPDEPKIRALVRERGRMLAEGIRNTYSRLENLREEINLEIIDKVEEINNIGKEIASLNGEISKVLAEGQNPNDLLDKRELLLENLSKIVDIEIERSKHEEFKVSIGGRVLVQGGHLYELETIEDPENDKMAKIQWRDSKEEVVITSGEVRALLDVRDDSIRDYHFARLDEYAIYLIDRFNEIHRAGFGLKGSRDIDFFEPFKTLEKEDRIFKIVGSKAGYVHKTDMDLHDPFDSGCITLAANPSMKGLHPEGAFEINGHIFHYVASEDSLQDIVKRINDAGIGVRAHISPERRLVLTATSTATYKGIKTPYTILSMSDDPKRAEFQSTSSRDEVSLNEIDLSRDFRTSGLDPSLILSARISVSGAVTWTSRRLGEYKSIQEFIDEAQTQGILISYNSANDRFTITNNTGGNITITDIDATSTNPVTHGFLNTGAKLTTTTSITLTPGGSSGSLEPVTPNHIDLVKTMSALDTTCAFDTAGFNTIPSTSLDVSQAFANAGFLNAPLGTSRITITDNDGNSWSSNAVSAYSSVQAFIDDVNTGCRNNGIELTLSYNDQADRFIFKAGDTDNITIDDAVGNFLDRTNFGAGPLSISAGSTATSSRGVGPGIRIVQGATTWEHALSDFSSIDEFMNSINDDTGLNLSMTYSLYSDTFNINNTGVAATVTEIIPTGGRGFWTEANLSTTLNPGNTTSSSEVVSNTTPAKTYTSFKRAGLITHAGDSVVTINNQDFYIDTERTSVREFMSAVNTSNCGVDITYDPSTDKFTIQANTRGTDFTISETLSIKSGREVSDAATINPLGDWTTGSGWDTNILPQRIRINGVEFRIGPGPLDLPNLDALINEVNNSMAGVTMSYSTSEPDRLTITSNTGQRIIIEGGLGAGESGDFWDEVGIERGIHGGLLTSAIIPSGKIAGNLLYKLGLIKEEKRYTWSPREEPPDPNLDNIFAGKYTRVPRDGAALLITLSEDIEDDLNKIAAAKGIDTSSPLDGVWDISKGTGDGSNAIELASLKEKDLFNEGTATFGEFLGETVSRVGTRTSVSKEEKENQETFLENLYNLRDSISGVSLDEEMINLIRFQQGYQAAARVTAVMNRLIQLIIALV
jgi:flagellar hook-associated protein FlgK